MTASHPLTSPGDPTEPPIYFSLVCATVDRTEELALLLRSLAAQAFSAFELIVVDQNEDDRLAALLSDAPEGLRVRHVRAPSRGANQARNMGARVAAGRWLGFPDDDCTYFPDTLQTLHARVAGGGVVAVSGDVLCEDGRTLVRTPDSALVVTEAHAFQLGSESCLFVEAAAFAEVGGFDERFGPGARYPATEGAELIFRLLGRGGGCRFEPAVRCRHPRKDHPDAPGQAARTRAYAFGTGATARRHGRVGQLAWLAAKSLVAMALFGGSRRAMYGARLAGLLEGYRAYGLAERPTP